jgi:hypothetical protein
MNVIVFSKDRAMQLDALLRSMVRFAPESEPITVLVRWREARYAESYQVLMADWPEVHFITESVFKTDLFTAIDANDDTLTMLVDDDVFYRPAPPVPDLKPGQCFSFRLGLNVRTNYVTGEPQGPGSDDFRYAYSQDGHVFRTEEILPLLQCLKYGGPNTLEQAMQQGPPLEVLHAEHSSLVNIPHNLVQTAWPQISPSMGGSAAELNARFLAGERIDLERMDFSDVAATHQYIPYVFKKV